MDHLQEQSKTPGYALERDQVGTGACTGSEATPHTMGCVKRYEACRFVTPPPYYMQSIERLGQVKLTARKREATQEQARGKGGWGGKEEMHTA